MTTKNKQTNKTTTTKRAEGACVCVCVCVCLCVCVRACLLAQLRTYDANYAVIVVPLSNYAVDI